MRQRLLSLFGMFLAALVILLPASGAHTDQIDGHWCFKKPSKQLSIDGPNIVTPHGTRMTGTYDRHGFIYQIPKNEPGAGSFVIMEQLSDDVMHLRTGKTRKDAEAAKPQTWGPCPPNIS